MQKAVRSLRFALAVDKTELSLLLSWLEWLLFLLSQFLYSAYDFLSVLGLTGYSINTNLFFHSVLPQILTLTLSKLCTPPLCNLWYPLDLDFNLQNFTTHQFIPACFIKDRPEFYLTNKKA